MLYIVPFFRRNDIYQYEWLKTGESVKIVVPHPKLADGFRETGKRYRSDLNIESTTIADFVKNEISYWNPDIKIYKKYRLIVELSTIWKKYFPLSSYDEFIGAFDSFTELRGITTNFNIIEEILSKSYVGQTDRDIESIERFWKYLEVREIYDEHAACSYLVEKYRNFISEKVPEKIIFYGFTHLSSGQCDLLDSMGKLHDIYIPLYANVWREAEESDWIKWINAEVLQISSSQIKTDKISLVKVGSNGLNEAIGELAETYCKNKLVEIVLIQKNPDFFHIGELPWSQISFKVETPIFFNTYTKIFNDMEDRLDWKNDFETETALNFLDEIIKKELNKNFDGKDFKTIRMASFIYDEIKRWMDLSEENSFMKMFDYNVFKNSLKLNLPRNYILPRTNRDMAAKVKGIEDIETVETDNFVIVCATKNYGDVDFSEDHRIEKMIESFLKIGPVKRKGLEFAIFKESMMDIFSEGSSLLIIEESLIKESLLWSEVLSNFDISEIILGGTEKKEKIDHIKTLEKRQYSLLESGKWSSGKIQKYLDCPRSFYYNYVDRIYFSPQNKQEVEATDLGSLQHKAIRSFMEQFDIMDEKAYDGLVQDIWDNFLQEKELFLDELNYKNYFLEVKNYSWRGIRTLSNIKNKYPGTNFSFEVEFDSDIHRGNIDCIIDLGNGLVGIVDFKRSEASVPYQTEIHNFQKIQLWYYMHNLKLEGQRLCFFGYICLAELEKSQFFFDENVFTMESFGNIFVERKGTACSFKEKENQFERFLADKMDGILADKKFLPIPQSNKMCRFCWIDKVCIKEALQ